ncbi:ornithine carbamoyltransferase [Candidatus Woesearchaeota archaeon]|nr:ornithine carbamoyltransferase [Candidatus Woesearchaeota archaeon]
MKHLASLIDWNSESILDLIGLAATIKKFPEKYHQALKNKTMLMIFEKPSLRTRVSFEVAMTQLGGHAIHLDAKDSPLGEKESISDTAKVSSRYCDIIMARLFRQEDIIELAKSSTVPVINGLTDTFHPCQILSDLFTINENKGRLKGLKLSFVGDGNNNITHELLLGCPAAGMDISVGCPKSLMPQKWVVDIAMKKAKTSGSKITINNNSKEAAKDADVVYTDTWMSYHVPKNEKIKRVSLLKPYQVSSDLMKLAKKDAVFMHCLPAMRGYEQAEEVIDGRQSIVFDQAENRLHMQKAIILKLLGKM